MCALADGSSICRAGMASTMALHVASPSRRIDHQPAGISSRGKRGNNPGIDVEQAIVGIPVRRDWLLNAVAHVACGTGSAGIDNVAAMFESGVGQQLCNVVTFIAQGIVGWCSAWGSPA